MERQERAEIVLSFDADRPVALSARVGAWPSVRQLSSAWECPRCATVVWVADAAPRCRRCGFWETAS